MYAVAPLIERAARLEPPSAQTAERIRNETFAHLRRAPYRTPVPGVAEVRLPPEQAVFERLVTAAMPPDWLEDEAVVAANILLTKPVYITPLPDALSDVQGRRTRQVGLAAAIRAEGDIWVGVGRLRIEQSTGRKPWSHDAAVDVDWYIDLDAACDALEALYLEAPNHTGLPKFARGMWIGGGKGTNSVVPNNWKERVSSVGRVAGYDIVVVENAGAHKDLPHRVVNEAPAALVDWLPHTVGKPQVITSRYQAEVADGLYVPLPDEDFEAALARLKRELRTKAIAPDKVMAPSIDEPKTVLEAVEIAVNECLNLHFLKESLSSAGESHFPRPVQVLEYLRALDSTVIAWRAGEIESGGFAQALTSLGVSRYMSGISKTARNNYSEDYERSYDGRTIELGPHVASGVGAITRILRIYWYVDTENQTFVIGHVGKKLRDASNP